MARDQSRRRKRGFNEVAQSDSYSNSNDTRTRDGREDFHGIRGRWNNLGRKKSVKSELWIFSFLCSLPARRGCFLSFYFFESEIKIEILRDTQGEVAVLRRNNVWRMSFRGNGTKVLCAREKVFGEFVTREQVSVLQSVQKTSVAFAPALFREVLYI